MNRATGTRSTRVDCSTRPVRSLVVCSLPTEPPTAVEQAVDAPPAPHRGPWRGDRQLGGADRPPGCRTTVPVGARCRLRARLGAVGAHRSARPRRRVVAAATAAPREGAAARAARPAATNRLTDLSPMTFPARAGGGNVRATAPVTRPGPDGFHPAAGRVDAFANLVTRDPLLPNPWRRGARRRAWSWSAPASQGSPRPRPSVVRRRDVDVVVLEASPVVGGKLRARRGRRASPSTSGAESMLNRRPEAVALARASGLGDRIVHPATTTANLWSRGRLRPMPRTLMGVPADARALADSGVLSAAGLARVALERGAARPPASTARTSASAGWSRSGSAARSSTGWWSRCSAASTPVTPARSPPAPRCRRSWRCWTGTAR